MAYKIIDDNDPDNNDTDDHAKSLSDIDYDDSSETSKDVIKMSGKNQSVNFKKH